MSKLLEQINNKKKNRIKLSKVADIVPGFSFKSSDFVENGIPLVKITEIQSPYVVLDKCSFVDISKYSRDKLSKFYLKSGEYVVAMTGATVGKVGKVISDTDILLNQRVAVVRPRGNFSKEFVNMQVSSPSFEAYIKRIASGSSAQANISGTDIGDFEFDIPDLPTQKKIAEIIGVYDEKIENNNFIIKKLEATAQTLFDEWFVNFHFPGYEKVEIVDSEMGEIPEGWEVKPLDQIADFLNGVASQKYPATNPKESLPVIKIREMNSGIDQNSDRATREIDNKYIIKNGDILFSWSGSLSLMLWVGGEGVLNQHIFKVTSESYPKWFVYQWIAKYLKNFKMIAEGKATTMGHIQRHHLSESLAIVPDSSFLKKANKIMANLFDQQILLQEENTSLKSQRDQLLAKLI